MKAYKGSKCYSVSTYIASASIDAAAASAAAAAAVVELVTLQME